MKDCRKYGSNVRQSSVSLALNNDDVNCELLLSKIYNNLKKEVVQKCAIPVVNGLKW